MSLNRYLWGFINMALHLLVYGDFTPNVDEGVHYDTLTYQKSKSAGKLLATINIDNYRINNNIARIDDNINNFKSISYIIEEDLQNRFYKCYYVTRIEQQSGYLLLYLSVDLWASYIEYAKINYPTIKRTNIKLNDNGFYDDITASKTDINYFNRLVAMGGIDGSASDYGIKYINDSEVNIIFLAKVVTERNPIGTTKSSITQLFGLHVSDAREVFNGVTFATPVNSASLAIDLISHTYKLSARNDINYEVEIIKAWLVPSNVIGYGTWNAYYYTMTSKPYWAEHAEKTFKAYFIKPCHVVETYTLQGSDYDINYKYYAGVYGYGLPLKNQTNKIITEVEYIATESDININIMQGDKQQDITNMFEVSLSGQAQSEDNLHKTQRWLHNISDMLGMTKSAVTAGMATKYGLGSIYEGAQYVLGLLDGIKDVRPEGTTNKGAGLSSFAWYLTNDDINNHLLNFPFYYTRFKSVFNENIHAGIYGASYNYEDNDTNNVILTLFIYNLIYVASQTYTNVKLGTYAHYLYLSMDANITGVPTDAIELIKTKFSKGIKIASQEWENAQ